MGKLTHSQSLASPMQSNRCELVFLIGSERWWEPTDLEALRTAGVSLSDFRSVRGRFYGTCPVGMGWSKSRQDAAPTAANRNVGAAPVGGVRGSGSCGRLPWERFL